MELQKDQLVACWDREDCDKAIRIYVGKEGIDHRCRLPGIEVGDPDFELWEHCVPLEEVAPEAFLAEPALVQRLRRQIEWLCRQIQSIADIEELGNVCPPVGRSPYYNDCQCNCIACWEQASLKAVEDEVKVN